LPRLVFINKLDRMGASHDRAIRQIRSKLNLNVAAIQHPIGTDTDFAGIIDLIKMKVMF